MKKFFTLIAALTVSVASFAQAEETISGNITANRTLDNDTIYFLDGFVYVKNGATLTIEPGTIIKGVSGNRSTLIITRGSKIVANGTKNQPIVFTSDQDPQFRSPGDWGGIAILGKATTNRPTDCTTCPGAAVAAAEPGIQTNLEGDIDNASGDGLYGGTDDNDNSGVLTYVRIEYAGVVISSGNEINGFTLGGVGKGTTIDHVQVSYANDDSFEWFGGTANAKHLISLGAIDDDFDVDFGFRGNVQFGIAQRDSNNYDTGSNPTTNGFESDNDGGSTYANPRTKPTFSNITVIGPLANGVALQQSNSFQNAARLRRNSLTSIHNSIFMGFPTGVLVDGNGSTAAYLGDTLLLKNNISAGATVSDIRSNTASDIAVKTKFEGPDNCDTLDSMNGILVAPFVYGNPNFFPTEGSPAASGASFASLADPFFTQTTYRGAFGNNDNWAECWAKFDPQNENYSTPNINYLDVNADFNFNTNLSIANFSNSSANATAYIWNFGDGSPVVTDANPSHTYPTQNATYNVTLIAIQPCGNDTITKQVQIIIGGVSEYANTLGVVVFPNPAQDLANINMTMPSNEVVSVELYDVTGKLQGTQAYGKLAAGKQNLQLNTADLTNGVYFVRIMAGNVNQTVRLVVAK